MRQTFRDKKLQQQFEDNGYVVIPLLDEQEIAALQNVYDTYTYNFGNRKGYHATPHSKDANYNLLIHNEIVKVAGERIKSFFIDYRPLIAIFFVKEPDPDSNLPMHQDWALVDENQHPSLGVWCPLVDVNEHNSNLWVLKGSHKHVQTVRGGPHFPDFPEYDVIEPAVYDKYIEKISVKAGTAICFDHRLLHCSPPNLSDKTRVAISVGMIPSEAQPIHYHKYPNNEVKMFAVDDDFFIQPYDGKAPDMPILSSFPYEFKGTYPEQKQQFIYVLKNDRQQGFVQKIKSLFTNKTAS